MTAVWIAKRIAWLATGAVTGGMPPSELEKIGRLLSGDAPKKPKREASS